jgi:methylenetetrahydrofolate reductase (NADPH)
MYIRDIFAKKKFTLSFEFFPPKQDTDLDKLYETINELKELNPDYVSVTYGAGGSRRDKTVGLASHIKNEIGLETIAHLTCVNSTKEDIQGVISSLKENNIQNILCLRGDPPAGEENFTKTIGGFGYASELTEFVRKSGDWCIGVAGYPEGHIEASSFEADLANLKNKVSKGADFIVTQMFFVNDKFYRYLDELAKLGIDKPVIPGIFPILNYKSVKRSAELSGATIPEKLVAVLEKYQDDSQAVAEIGIEYAINQCEDLIKSGRIRGLHLYSMNKSYATKKIYEAIKQYIPR